MSFLKVVECIAGIDKIKIKINDQEFNMPRIIIESHFVTAGIENFADIHNYSIETGDAPETIFKEIIKYSLLLFGSCDYDDIEDISVGAIKFIDKYYVDQEKMIKIVYKEYETAIKNINSAHSLSNVLNLLQDTHVYNLSAEDNTLVIKIIEEEFPETMSRIINIVGYSKKPFTLCEEKGSRIGRLHRKIFYELSKDVDGFLPKFMECYIKHFGIEMKI